MGWRRTWGKGGAEVENEAFDPRLVIEVGRGHRPRFVERIENDPEPEYVS